MDEENDLLSCQKDAKRYRWLRYQLGNGNETYIGESCFSEDELDKYIDDQMEK